jgi:hypothetical protein
MITFISYLRCSVVVCLRSSAAISACGIRGRRGIERPFRVKRRAA